MARAPKFSFPMPSEETLELIPRKYALHFKVLPVRATSSTLTVVTPNPANATMINELRHHAGCQIDARQVSEAEIDDALELAYGYDAVKETARRRDVGAATPRLSPGDAHPRRVEGSSGSVRMSDPKTYPSGNSGRLTGGSGSFSATKSGTWQRTEGPSASYSLSRPTSAPAESSGVISSHAPASANRGEGASGAFHLRNPGDYDDQLPPGVAEAVTDRGPAMSTAEFNAEPSGEMMSIIERGTAGMEGISDEADAASIIAGSVETMLQRLLIDAVGMGASEIFVDPMDDRFLFRARIEGRLATLHEIEKKDGSDVLSRLRALASIPQVGDTGEDVGRINFPMGGGRQVDIFLRTFRGRVYEHHVLDVIRHPAVQIPPVEPIGLNEGSPERLLDLLSIKLKEAGLARAVTGLLTGDPCLIAVAAPRHRPRESMLSLLAGAVAGPSLGLRTIYAGERPRYYLEDQGVVLRRAARRERREAYRSASHMSADYLFLEEVVTDEELALAMRASATHHVIFGIPAADPIDLLLALSEAPESRRLAHRMGAILFLEETSLKVCVMTDPLKEAVGSMEDAATFEDLFESEAALGVSPALQSMELRAFDPGKMERKEG